MNQKELKNEALSITGSLGLLRKSYVAVTQNWPAYFGLLALTVAVALVATAISSGLILGLSFLIDSIGWRYTFLLYSQFALYAVFTGLIALGCYAMIYFTDKLEDNAGIWQAYKQSYRNFFRIFTTHLTVVILVQLSLFLLVVPGIYLAIRYIFALYISALEAKKVVSSLKTSWNLTRNFWWEIAVRIFMLGITIFIGYLFISLCLVLLDYVLPLNASGIYLILTITILILALSVVVPFGLSYIYFLYKEILELKQKSPETKGQVGVAVKIFGIVIIILFALVAIVDFLSPADKSIESLEINQMQQ